MASVKTLDFSTDSSLLPHEALHGRSEAAEKNISDLKEDFKEEAVQFGKYVQ